MLPGEEGGEEHLRPEDTNPARTAGRESGRGRGEHGGLLAAPPVGNGLLFQNKYTNPHLQGGAVFPGVVGELWAMRGRPCEAWDQVSRPPQRHLLTPSAPDVHECLEAEAPSSVPGRKPASRPAPPCLSRSFTCGTHPALSPRTQCETEHSFSFLKMRTPSLPRGC